MNPVLRNVLAVVVGVIVGMFVNGLIIMVSSSIIPPPEGADLTTPEGLQAAILLMEPKHFLMPWLAHAFGTFVGALIAALIASTRKMSSALIVGLFSFIGGVAAAFMIPAPLWFELTDLILAYFPMAFIAAKVASKKK